MSSYLSHPNIIPYITAREGEEGEWARMLGVRKGNAGLRYLNEESRDRDTRGVLWARCSQNLEDGRPAGKPRWSEVHPSRQRETMMYLRCQVCAEPASRTESGYLFLCARPADSTVEPGWPQEVLTAQPPLCLEHAVAASRQCAHLTAAGYVALRSRRPRLYGVLGTAYAPDGSGSVAALPASSQPLRYGHPYAAWYLASQMVRQLFDVRIVDLDSELAVAAGGGTPRKTAPGS